MARFFFTNTKLLILLTRHALDNRNLNQSYRSIRVLVFRESLIKRIWIPIKDGA